MLSMLSNGALTALIDIRFNIVLIDDFVGGFTFDVFERELKTIYATTRALEIISEASRRLPGDLKNRHPDIPWDKVRSAANIYRHDYESVEAAFIWKTVHESLPPLLAIIETELAAADRNKSNDS